MKLVASMIVRNELDRYLPECIAHLKEFCDEICVLEDASDDDSFSWLAAQDVMLAPRVPSPQFFRNEGAARQALFSWTMQAQPSHILAIDADEFVSDGARLRELCGHVRPVWSLNMEEVWRVDSKGLHIRDDGGWRPHAVPILYQAPTRPDNRRWRIAPKRLACGREPMAVRQQMAKPSDVSIFHFGWACEADREARYQRYVEADGGKYHASQHLLSIMWNDEMVQTHTRPWPKSLTPYRKVLTERAHRVDPQLV